MRRLVGRKLDTNFIIVIQFLTPFEINWDVHI